MSWRFGLPTSQRQLARDLDEKELRNHAPTWERRFALLDRVWRKRLQGAPEVPPIVTSAWHALTRSAGRVAVAELAQSLGCSRKRLTAGFREHVGLLPKSLARIIRFRRVVQCLVASEGERLSETAPA